MFDVSFTELLVIGGVALVVIGPERLPKVARTVGHLLGRAQRYVNDVKADIQREVELDELRKFKQDIDSAAQDVTQSMHQMTSTIQHSGDALRAELDDAAQTIKTAGTHEQTSANTHIASPHTAPPAAPAVEEPTQNPPNGNIT